MRCDIQLALQKFKSFVYFAVELAILRHRGLHSLVLLYDGVLNFSEFELMCSDFCGDTPIIGVLRWIRTGETFFSKVFRLRASRL